MNRSAVVALDSLERVVSSVQIGSFEHNLTTDLLNHLVFLQKVFMKEVNEVIQKVSGDGPHTFAKFSSDCRLHSSTSDSKITGTRAGFPSKHNY